MCSYVKVEAISINVILNYDVMYVTYIVNPINNVDFPQLQATGASFFRVFRRYLNQLFSDTAEAFPWAILKRVG